MLSSASSRSPRQTSPFLSSTVIMPPSASCRRMMGIPMPALPVTDTGTASHSCCVFGVGFECEIRSRKAGRQKSKGGQKRGEEGLLKLKQDHQQTTKKCRRLPRERPVMVATARHTFCHAQSHYILQRGETTNHWGSNTYQIRTASCFLCVGRDRPLFFFFPIKIQYPTQSIGKLAHLQMKTRPFQNVQYSTARAGSFLSGHTQHQLGQVLRFSVNVCFYLA